MRVQTSDWTKRSCLEVDRLWGHAGVWRIPADKMAELTTTRDLKKDYCPVLILSRRSCEAFRGISVPLHVSV
jgi:hypothetical protein